MASESDKMKSKFTAAIEFVNKIKARFVNDEKVYKSFLKVLSMHRDGKYSAVDVYKEMTILFKDHHDLLEEFSGYLPSTDAITEKSAESIPETSGECVTEKSAESIPETSADSDTEKSASSWV